MKVSFSEQNIPDSGILCIVVNNDVLDSFQSTVNAKAGDILKRAVNQDDFSFKKGSTVSIPVPAGLSVSEIKLFGIDDSEPVTAQKLEELGARIWAALGKTQEKDIAVYLPKLRNTTVDKNQAIALVSSGMLLRSWEFNKYFTKKKKSDSCQVKAVTVLTDEPKACKEHFNIQKEIAAGVFLTRHVVSEPPNVIYPATLAEEAKKLEELGVKVEILDEKELRKLGCHSLLGVGQGSEKESYMVVMHWLGGRKDEAPVAFVGKGVTFDTGGISIKGSEDMDQMKWDMAGAGAVLGLMRALAGRKAKVNAIGVMGLVENMPSGSAQRPGDVVTSMSGQTIEILNTDAEGRLVLADALWYTQDRFKPQAMIDLATLTMAIIIALGTDHAGLFSNNDMLSEMLTNAGKKTDEKLWRQPMNETYNKDMDSTIADMRNIGSGRAAGSITAAQFLERFVNKTNWAHLDIAGTAWDKKGRPLSAPGATGFGVRLLNQLVADNFEN